MTTANNTEPVSAGQIDAGTVLLASYGGNTSLLVEASRHSDPHLRSLALGGLHKNDALTLEHVRAAEADPEELVRHRIARLGATDTRVDLSRLLHDANFAVAETAAWSFGERVVVSDEQLTLLISMSSAHSHLIVRESCVAALGAIGDIRALPAILAACSDKPAIRRRAVLALAPFDGPEVDAALRAALTDRDWQVRQAAEDLLSIEEDADADIEEHADVDSLDDGEAT